MPVPLLCLWMLLTQEATVVVRSTTRMVEVSVIAADKAGRRVADLKKEDFVLTEDGKGQEIRVFTMEKGESVSASQAALPAGFFSNRLEENFRAMSEPFGPGDEKLLAAINQDIRPLYCRMCYRCDGQCPKGAAVPETIRYLSYADFYGQFAVGREHFASLPETARSIRCGDCGSCSVVCPNGVQVAERMIRAQELFA